MERQLEVRGGKMNALQKLIPDRLERLLLFGAPLERGGASPQNHGHGLGDKRIVVDVFPRDHEQAQDTTELVDSRGWDQVSYWVNVLQR